MTPEPIPPNQIVIQHHASISAGEVLNVINQVVKTTLPIIVQTYPPAAGASMAVTTVLGLAELGLPVVIQIGQLISGLHNKKAATPVLTATTVTL
jgi:hypothetical protein